MLVDLLVNPKGGTGATLNLLDLSTDLLDTAASLWTWGLLGRFLGASVVLVDILVDPRGGTGATLNLVDLSTDLLDTAASLWIKNCLGHLCSVFGNLIKG